MTQALAKGLSVWAAKVRAHFFTASLVPLLLGTAVAWVRDGQFDLSYCLLTFTGVLLLHAAANMSNDYFDHESGTDDLNVEFGGHLTGGSRMIQTGAIQPGHVLIEALAYYAAGSIIGIYLGWVRGPWVLIIGLVGILFAYFYTAPPIFLAARGLGEVVVGLTFGVLIALGTYYVQTGWLAWEPALAGLPASFLLAGVLYINEFQDMPADKAAGKNNLLVRLGRKKAVPGYALIMGAAYLSIVVGVLAGLTPFTLLGLLPGLLAWRAWQIAQVKYDSPGELVRANVYTFQAHLYTGLLLALGYIIQGVMRV